MQKGEAILLIPNDGDSIININDLPGSPIFDLWNSCNLANFADKDDETMVQQMFLALFFIWHRRQGEASRFKVYLDSLPGQSHLITQWTRAVRCRSFTIGATHRYLHRKCARRATCRSTLVRTRARR